MSSKQKHRGPGPDDERLFAPPAWPALRRAVNELSWLLSRAYAMPSSLKLVGDRYDLNERQRTAVMRCACTDDAKRSRLAREVPSNSMAGRPLFIDGYNLLTTIETALSGGFIFLARDTSFRDMASVHGTHRNVEETIPALKLCGEALRSLDVGATTWLLDQPVSNSGRLAAMIRQIGEAGAWHWNVEVVPNPDAILSESDTTIATADSVILDRCASWVSLARHVVSKRVPDARIVDLSDEARSG